MNTGRPQTIGKNKVSIRVLFSEEDYEELKRIAEWERTDVSTLIRRAVARYFFTPANSNNTNETVEQ